MTKLSM